MKKFTLLLIFILSITSGKILAQCVTVGPDITICQGSPVPGLGAAMINGTTDISWSDNVGGAFSDPAKFDATWTPPVGFTGTATLTLTPLLGCIGSPVSLKVTINPPVAPSVSISASATTICAGASVTFTANPANGGSSPTYVWIKNSIATGATGPTFTTTVLNNGDQVEVILTSNDPCATTPTASSNMISMTVNPVLNASVTIAASPTGPICPGATVLFTATAFNTGTSPVYEWTVDGSPVGTNSSTYSTTTLTTGNVVSVKMTSNLPCVTGSPATSNAITMTVNAAAPVSVSIAASSNNVCAGTNVTFTATPTNGGTTPIYQWMVNGGNVGTNSPTYSSTTLANGNIVTVRMTSNIACASGSPATSNPITMTVNPTTPVSVSIAALPTGAICAGTSVTFTATPTGGGTPTYQWRVNGVNTGTNNASFTSTTLSNNDAVTVQMTSSLTCPSAAPATSNAITMSVNALPVAGLTSSDPDHIICEGTSVTFTASGGTSYAFNVGGVIVQTGALSTFTTTTLSNGQSVYVVVGNAASCATTSASMMFLVNSPPFISDPSPAVCAANLATYSFTIVSAAPVTASAGVAANTSGNNWTVTVPAGTNTIVSATSGGCVSTKSVTAPNCACPVVAAPVSGGDRNYCAGGAIPALTATVGAGETIDWYNVASGGTSALATGLSYTPTIPGTYYAAARNTTTSCVSSSRTPIVLTANPLPIATIVSSETDNTICTGASVTFTGSGGANYNFRIAGVSAQSGVLTTFTTTALTNGQIVDVIVTSAAGCIATSAGITNTVRALPTPTLTSSDPDNTFCSGSSVTFTASGGTNYNFRVAGASVQNSAAATYVTNALLTGQVVDVIVTNANGCSATSAGITNTVSALPVPLLTSSDADHQFCFGTSVSFTAGTGSTNYNFRVGGTTVQNGASNIYTTSTLTNGQAVDVITTNAAGCTATSAAITNIVSPQPTANGGAGGNICGLTFKFSGVPGIGLGTWTKTTGPGNASFAPNANTANATVTVSEYGAYTFTWTEVSGQCSASSIVAVNFYLQPVSNAGTGGNNCGLGFHFSGSLNTGVGTWAKVSGPGNVTYSPDANTPNALVTVSGYGTYTFSWTVVNGTCSNSSNVNVVFIQQVPASGGSDGSECDKDFVLNAALPANGTGTWTKFAGPGNAVFAPDNHTINAKVTVDKFGTYDFAWTVVNSTCSSSDVIRVVFHDLPAINAGRDTIMCKGSSIQLKALGSGTVAWTPAAKLNNANIINPVASPDVTTTYTVNLTDQFGCKNSDNMVLGVRERTVADAGPDQELIYVLNSTLNASLAHDYEKGFWSVISGTSVLSDSTYAKSSVEDLSIGLNEFLWTVSNGYCPVSVDTANIVVNDFVIPTLITPNMDGRNDYFVLSGLSTLGKADLVIFDRRGAQVYKNADYDNLWDGVDYNNNPLPEGTYFYMLKTANGKSLSGYIVIRR